MKKKIVFIVLAGSVLVLILYIAGIIYQGEKTLSENPMVLHKEAPVDFVRLFKPGVTRKLLLKMSVSFKNRNPVAAFVYDHKYHLEITKINVNDKFKVDRDVVDLREKPAGTYPEPEFHFGESSFITNYNVISIKKAEKIYLYLQGDNIVKVAKNDSIAEYCFNLEKLCVQYQRKGMFEIFAEPRSLLNFDFKASEIMFVKKSDQLYFLLLTPRKKEDVLSPQLLRSLLSGEYGNID